VLLLNTTRQEAILRRWLTARQAMWLLLLDVATRNAFVSLFFTWGHEAIVYTTAHRSFILYAAVLSTFLVQAFYFDPGERVKERSE
jgi:hypothetical protein